MTKLKTLVVSFLCVAIVCGIPQSGTSGRNINGIFDPVIELLDTLRDIVDKSVNDALLDIQNLIQTILDTTKQTVDSITKSLTDTSASLIQQINDMVTSATGLGIDITPCVGDSVQQISDLEADVSYTVTNCIDNAANRTLSVLRKTIDEINGTVGEVEDLFSSFDNCQGQSILVQPVCIASLTVEVTQAIASIPIEIGKYVANVSTTAAQLTVEIAGCQANVIEDFYKNGAETVSKVTTCAKAIINPPGNFYL
ncbi:uncharacterized protein LOC132704882 [Cylas formicarius]|uniref:uncharacterized protein LOC132704882 n=1 Tax=Cylas formicarius TaxID=197179 RepID=UPI0029583CA9|nr:uncharacterized protein LOC132704882 [Cylas formicarius]